MESDLHQRSLDRSRPVNMGGNSCSTQKTRECWFLYFVCLTIGMQSNTYPSPTHYLVFLYVTGEGASVSSAFITRKTRSPVSNLLKRQRG